MGAAARLTSAGSAGTNASAPTTLSVTGINLWGNLRLLVAEIWIGASGAVGGNDSTVTDSLTYAGRTMTSLGIKHSNNGNTGYVELFWLVNPPPHGDLVATVAGFTATGSENVVGLGYLGFQNVDQRTPLTLMTATAGNGTTASITVTGIRPPDLGVAVFGGGSGFTAFSANATQRWIVNQNELSACGCGAGSTTASLGSQTMTATLGSDSWAAQAFVVNGAKGSKLVLPILLHKASGAASTSATAGVASGTGTAYNPTTTGAPVAGVAAATGAAGNPTATVAPVAGVASGTGTAFGATVSVAVVAGVASGTGAAGGASATVAPVAGLASGTGTAYNPTVSTSASTSATAGLAAGTGTAYNPTATVAALLGVAAGTGTAYGPAATVAVVVGVASGTGTAYNPTVNTSSSTSAAAGVAAGTGTAYNPKATVAVVAGVSTGTGTALTPTVAALIAVGVAAGTGAAYAVTVALAPSPPAALGAGTAYNPKVAIAVLVGIATALGSAYGPLVVAGGVYTVTGHLRTSRATDPRTTSRASDARITKAVNR